MIYLFIYYIALNLFHEVDSKNYLLEKSRTKKLLPQLLHIMQKKKDKTMLQQTAPCSREIHFQFFLPVMTFYYANNGI